MHRLAESKILSGLKAMGLVKGDVEEMVQQRIGALFMPHGEESRLSLSVMTPGRPHAALQPWPHHLGLGKGLQNPATADPLHSAFGAPQLASCAVSRACSGARQACHPPQLCGQQAPLQHASLATDGYS